MKWAGVADICVRGRTYQSIYSVLLPLVYPSGVGARDHEMHDDVVEADDIEDVRLDPWAQGHIVSHEECAEVGRDCDHKFDT